MACGKLGTLWSLGFARFPRYNQIKINDLQSYYSKKKSIKNSIFVHIWYFYILFCSVLNVEILFSYRRFHYEINDWDLKYNANASY